MIEVRPQVMSPSTFIRSIGSEKLLRKAHRIEAGEDFDKVMRSSYPAAFCKYMNGSETLFGVKYRVGGNQPSSLATVLIKRRFADA